MRRQDLFGKKFGLAQLTHCQTRRLFAERLDLLLQAAAGWAVFNLLL